MICSVLRSLSARGRVHGWLTIALHCGYAQRHSGGTHNGRGREGGEGDGEGVDKAASTLANQKRAAWPFNQCNTLFLSAFMFKRKHECDKIASVVLIDESCGNSQMA